MNSFSVSKLEKVLKLMEQFNITRLNVDGMEIERGFNMAPPSSISMDDVESSYPSPDDLEASLYKLGQEL